MLIKRVDLCEQRGKHFVRTAAANQNCLYFTDVFDSVFPALGLASQKRGAVDEFENTSEERMELAAENGRESSHDRVALDMSWEEEICGEETRQESNMERRRQRLANCKRRLEQLLASEIFAGIE